MFVFLLIGTTLATVFYVVNVLIYYLTRTSISKNDLMITYECGFEAVQNQARTQHSISYYLIALLYVIFDLEIALILPALVSLSMLGMTGGVLLIAIMSLLCLAFVYEFQLGTFSHVNPIQ
jgi:NADH:ubiquinone oxidoreductase subunit 3 (subunit A)